MTFPLCSISEPCSNCGFMKSSSDDPLPALPRHLVATNDPPTDAEAAEMRDVVDKLHTHISDIGASIKNAEDLVARLRSRRKSAIKDARRGRGIVSVIRRLPDDVLREIFSHTIPETRSEALWSTPWVLGGVCSRWRAISVSLSTLWSHLDTGIPLPMLVEQIERSKGCALTVDLIETKNLDPLINCSSRWEIVDIRLGHDMLAILERVHGKALPMMRRLNCWEEHNRKPDRLGPISSCAAFQIAPNLSSVSIHGCASLRLPWGQLTTLHEFTLCPPFPEVDCIGELRSARNLVELSLVGSVSPTLLSVLAHGLPESMMELPLLRLLEVVDGEILNFLVLPALEKIHIWRCSPPLLSLVERSSCLLRNITSFDSDLNIIPVLERTPTILALDIALTSADRDRLIAYLAIPVAADSDATGARPNCPELHTLGLYGRGATDEHQSVLLAQVVGSRLHSPTCSSLSVRSGRKVSCRRMGRWSQYL